jgi:predicted RNA binding protein YcfA (HicA-like mRNA interferase family)
VPSDARFAAFRRFLEDHGYTLDRTSGSHHIFTKPGHPAISVPVHRGQVAWVYIRKAEKALGSKF